MGLDDFKTSSSSSTASQAGSTKSSSGESSSSVNIDTSEPDEITPWFTAVIDKDDEEVKVFMEKQAFHRSGRHLNEKFLTCIETEDEFEKFNDVCQELHGSDLEEFFYRDPIRAQDFVDRLDSSKSDDTEVECAVCGKTILVEEDSYTKINDELVHADHRVDDVVKELDIRV